MKKVKVLLLLGILCVLVVSCLTPKTDQPAAEETTQATKPTAVEGVGAATLPTVDAVKTASTQFATIPMLPTKIPTLLPTLTPTIVSWVIRTPNAPVALPTVKANVDDLLKTNGGCSLPCWWKIEPGKTSFTTAFNQLSPLTTFIAIRKSDDMDWLDAEFRFPVPEANSSQEITITYKVENEIIQLIEINPGDINQYRFSQLLKDYGNPEEVWVEGLIDPTSNNPFIVYFYYPQKGIIATFWVDAVDLGDKLQVCPGKISPIVLVLWEPDGFESFIDFTGNTYGLDYIRKENRSLISLEQSTNQTLVEISENNCFETPKKLWPVR